MIVVFAIGGLLLTVRQMSRKTKRFQPERVIFAAFYDLNPRKIRGNERVQQAKGYVLSPSNARLLFASTERDDTLLLKGTFLGIVRYEDGQEFQLAISNYGGFFKVIDTGEQFRFTALSHSIYENQRSAALTNVWYLERLKAKQD